MMAFISIGRSKKTFQWHMDKPHLFWSIIGKQVMLIVFQHYSAYGLVTCESNSENNGEDFSPRILLNRGAIKQ